MVIIMLPKTLRLITAYSLLAATGVSMVIHDNSARRNMRATTDNSSAFHEQAAPVPMPMTRLEESPFLKAHDADPDFAIESNAEFAAAKHAQSTRTD